MRSFLFLSTIFVLGHSFAPVHSLQANTPFITKADTAIVVPIGGNTWAQQAATQSRLISNEGIKNWSNKDVSFETYLRINQPGLVKIKIKAKAASESLLQVSINNKKRQVAIRGDDYKSYEVGEWKIKDTGYVKLTLSGIKKSGTQFADISGYEISGTAINAKTAFVKNNEGNFFYWGRRGPSVHLNYPYDGNIQAAWYYNEITVPKGQDVIGSYYMANGFAEGYFGIQVNSPTERRVLFSVWSPFSTDDPKSIPPDMRIILLKKGENVYTGEFGNEGSGGQSYLKYNWIAGNTYKFLLNGQPDDNGNTVFTAYFFAPEKNEWMLIASFRRPKTSTYLKRFHSFLENFNPEQGNKERTVLFGNQWIRDVQGNWLELNRASFTYDNTAAKGYRLDYAGGVTKGQFYLKNCGFFNEYTSYRSVFERPKTNRKPEIPFEKLP